MSDTKKSADTLAIEAKERKIRRKKLANKNNANFDPFKKYGISRFKEIKPETRKVTLDTLRKAEKDSSDRKLYELVEDLKGVVELREGVTGTNIQHGKIRTDPDPYKRPYVLRGRVSQPGRYEEAYTEANVFRGVNETRNLLLSGQWSLQHPSLPIDDELNPIQEEHQFHTEWLDKKLKDIKVGDQGQRGMKAFIEQVSSMLIHGFAVFEIEWSKDPETGWSYPKSILFREQSTVWEWLISLEEDELAACLFQTGDDHARQYALKAGGPRLEDQELLHFAINRRGKNYEGISLLRPALYWIELKILLSRIAGASADLQGVPVRYVRNAMEALKEDVEMASNADLDETLDDLHDLEEGRASIIKLPNGAEVGVLASDNTNMIDVEPLLNYSDQQIVMAFNSEGALLGQQQTGSYALAEVSDQQMLSMIPYYEECICNPVNELVRRITLHNLDGAVPEEGYASLMMTFHNARDNTAFLEDLRKLMEARFWLWPQDLREVILDEMSLPTDMFDDWDPQELLDALPSKPQTNAFSEHSPLGEGEGNPLLSLFRKMKKERSSN